MADGHVLQAGAEPSRLEALANQVTFLRTIIAVLVGLIVLGFSCGAVWTTLNYRLQESETGIKENGKLIASLKSDVGRFKHNLGNLGLEIKPTDHGYGVDNDSWTACEGGAVGGLRYDKATQKLLVRCVSVKDAIWSETPATQANQ